MHDSLSRRRVLAGAAGLGSAAVAYATVGLSPVRAQVSADGLDIADAQYAATGGSIYSPRLSVDAAYAYEGVEQASAVMVACLVDGGLLASAVVDGVAAGSDSGRRTLAAPLVESRTVDSEMWTVPDGQAEVARTVTVEARLEVRGSGGETLAKDSAATDVTITITDAGPRVTATLSGTGEMSFLPTEGGTPVSGE
jgi:hypothetical protein